MDKQILHICIIIILFYINKVLLDEDFITKNIFNDGDVQILTDIEGNFEEIFEDNVIILTRHNFNHILYKNEYVLVEFYAPWCTHCKLLAPEFAMAAGDMKDVDLNVILGKVDVTIEMELAKEYSINGFPTILLFHKGIKSENYNGERNAQGIINYLTIRCNPTWSPPPTDVIELNGTNFKKYLNKKPLTLVLFYADYCQHCNKVLKPEYIEAAEILKNYGIPLVQINGEIEKKIADEYKVIEWPKIFIFRYGRAFDYKGGKELSKDIIFHMKKQLKSPTIKCKNLNELQNHSDRYLPTIIGIFINNQSNLFQEFYMVANYLRDEPMKFIHTFNKNIKNSYGIDEEGIIVKKAEIFTSDYENINSILIDKTKTGDEIAEFIRINYRPLVGQRTKLNQNLVYSKRPLVVIYYDANFQYEYEKSSQIIRNKIIEVAKDFTEITFAVANEDDYIEELAAVKLDDTGVDVNVIWYGTNRIKYRMDPIDEFDGSDLRNFINHAIGNKLKPVWKSQPIPKKQEGNIFITVADNFEDFYKEAKKDIFFYIYAPWCGHCKEFEKIFEKLSKNIKKIHFAKMDGSLNDLPIGFDIKGYPTIFYIKSDRKYEPILYDGDRSYEHIKNFINKYMKKSRKEEL